MAKTYRKRVKTEGRVENRSDLFNYILAKLTSDSIPVQDDQVHIAIDDAWEKFNNHHHLANEEFFAIYRYTDEDLARFSSPPVICLIEKNDRKPFLKRRPFSRSKFYTESFEGLNEEKQNQSYLPIKNNPYNSETEVLTIIIDSDSVLDGLDDNYKKAYRHEVTIDDETIVLWKYTYKDDKNTTNDSDDKNITIWIAFDGSVEIDDTATVRHYNTTIKQYPYKVSYTSDVETGREKALPITKNDADGTELDETNDADKSLLDKKITDIAEDDGLSIPAGIIGTYTTISKMGTKTNNTEYVILPDIIESETTQIFFDKGKNPALMDDEFIEESDQISDDQWYYLVRKMIPSDDIETLLTEPVKGEAEYTKKLATYESNVNEYENIIQNDMIDFEKVDRNYIADKQYGYFFSGGVYWSQANQNDLIVNNIFVDLPEDIGSITKIVNATGQSFGTFFTGLENTALLNSSFASVYGASTAGVGALMQFDMVGFFVMNRHFDMMNKYIVSEQPIGFSFQNKRLYIYDNIKRFVKGDTMMMKGYKRSSNVSQGDLWNNIWLKEYATALTQRQWALNITNASGVTGPGNATLPAQEILAEANTQIEKLEQQLYNFLQPGSRIISG